MGSKWALGCYIEHTAMEIAGKNQQDGRNIGIDLSRVMAAFAIVCYHTMMFYDENGGQTVMGIHLSQLVGGLFLWGRVPFFLILSGYLASRSLSKPGVSIRRFVQTRVIGLGVPYLVWNALALAMQSAAPLLSVTYGDAAAQGPGFYVAAILGIGSAPADYPMWFIRDIIVLSCLAPLFFRFRNWIFVPAMVLVCLPAISGGWLDFGMPRPSSWGYYALGMLIHQLDVRRLGALSASPMQGWIMCLALGCLSVFIPGITLGAIGPLLGAFSLFLLGQAIAGGNARLANLILSATPATFLIFAANGPIIGSIKRLLIRYADLDNSQKLLFYCLLPFVLTVLLVITHNQIRKFFPKLLFPLTGGR